jgi:ribose-phosphate pyrophosphokinase
VLDPHSLVTPALIERCVVHMPQLHSVVRHAYLGVISPDGGADKRAHSIAGQLDLPVFHGWKTRSPTTGALTGFGVEWVRAGHYPVADDICDAGGTFLGLAEKMRDYNASADLFVSHGLFTNGFTRLLGAFELVYTSDSMLTAVDITTSFGNSRFVLVPTVHQMTLAAAGA